MRVNGGFVTSLVVSAFVAVLFGRGFNWSLIQSVSAGVGVFMVLGAISSIVSAESK